MVLLGDEPVGPYHRLPLSKRLLKGELEQPLQPKTLYADQGIELRTQTRAVGRAGSPTHNSAVRSISDELDGLVVRVPKVEG